MFGLVLFSRDCGVFLLNLCCLLQFVLSISYLEVEAGVVRFVL